jgi:amidase
MEWWRKGAVELAKAIASREVTSREVVESHLGRIEQVNPQVNAVVRTMADTALAAADAADAAVRRGDRLGPLHGVPCTVKENIDVAGLPTTQGIAALADAVPDRDAPVVERIRAAGAIPIARTNLPDLGLRVHTDSALYGRTKNPWAADRTAGGSSGGEAAALATGMSPLGLGNDIGGSLRNPAHCCGIASIKPSSGVVPDAQTFPIEDIGLSAQLMLNQGPMARRIADVRAGLLALAGPHPRDPVSAPVVLEGAQGRRLRVAVMADVPGGSVHPDIRSAVIGAGRVLESIGHAVEEVMPPHVEEACETWRTQMNGELTLQLELLDAVMGEGGRAFLHLTKDLSPAVGIAEWSQAQYRRNGIGRAWSEWFAQWDVLLCPVWTQPPFTFDADISGPEGARATLELLRPVLPPNLLGLPAAVVPFGFADGMPVGVQVVSARYRDLLVLDVAEEIEQSSDVVTPIDPRA